MHDAERIESELKEVVAEMSPDARRVWEAIRESAGEQLPPEYGDLLPSEQAALGRAVRTMIDLRTALAEQDAGVAALARQMRSVFVRAEQLEPALVGKNVTLGEAVGVLERHGERTGISPEVFDMSFRVPKTG